MYYGFAIFFVPAVGPFLVCDLGLIVIASAMLASLSNLLAFLSTLSPPEVVDAISLVFGFSVVRLGTLFVYRSLRLLLRDVTFLLPRGYDCRLLAGH